MGAEIVLCNTKTANQVYLDLQMAFDIFNTDIFEGALPPVVFTLTRKKNTLGYFWADRFSLSDKNHHEIAINPSYFVSHTPQETALTLLHEMVHHWQQVFGSPSRSGYHNKEWAEKMKSVGLQPTAIDDPEKETGQKATHLPIPNGIALKIFAKIVEAGYRRAVIENPLLKKVSKPTRYKYMCETCGQKAYGNASSSLMCGVCETSLVRGT